MKKMPHALYLSIFLLIVGIIAGGLLSGVNAITKPIIEKNKIAAIEKNLKELGVTDVQLTDEETIAGVENIYLGKLDSKDVVVVIASNQNAYTNVSVISVIEKATGTLLNAKITGAPTITTHGMDANFKPDSMGLIGATSSDSMTAVSGATISSTSVKKCLDLAFEQFRTMAGGNVEVPTTAKLSEVTQDFSENTFNKFTANVVVNSKDLKDEKIKVTFTVEDNKVNFVSADKEMAEDVKAACLKVLKAPSNYIKSYVSETNEYTVITTTNFGSTFTTVLSVDAERKVTKYSVTAAPDFVNMWDNPGQAAWDGFTSNFIGGTLAAGNKVAGVSNCTISSNAIKLALTLVNSYLDSKTGGAN